VTDTQQQPSALHTPILSPGEKRLLRPRGSLQIPPSRVSQTPLPMQDRSGLLV
jgi:hypothetical protein